MLQVGIEPTIPRVGAVGQFHSAGASPRSCTLERWAHNGRPDGGCNRSHGGEVPGTRSFVLWSMRWYSAWELHPPGAVCDTAASLRRPAEHEVVAGARVALASSGYGPGLGLTPVYPASGSGGALRSCTGLVTGMGRVPTLLGQRARMVQRPGVPPGGAGLEGLPATGSALRRWWWRRRVTLPSGLACKACLDPCPAPEVVECTGNAPVRPGLPALVEPLFAPREVVETAGNAPARARVRGVPGPLPCPREW